MMKLSRWWEDFFYFVELFVYYLLNYVNFIFFAVFIMNNFKRLVVVNILSTNYSTYNENIQISSN